MNPLKPSHIIIIISAVIWVAPLPSVTASSLRCGARLITVGDVMHRVLAECGEPDHVQIWQEEQVYGFQHPPGYYGIYEDFEYLNPQSRLGSPYRIRKLVVVEVWTYNHGPARFLDHLRFENGIVRSISSGDYGY